MTTYTAPYAVDQPAQPFLILAHNRAVGCSDPVPTPWHLEDAIEAAKEFLNSRQEHYDSATVLRYSEGTKMYSQVEWFGKQAA